MQNNVYSKLETIKAIDPNSNSKPAEAEPYELLYDDPVLSSLYINTIHAINDIKENRYAQKFLLNNNTHDRINNIKATPPSIVTMAGNDPELHDIDWPKPDALDLALTQGRKRLIIEKINNISEVIDKNDQ